MIFASAHAKNENPVKTAKHMPRLQGRELEQELARYFDDTENVEARAASRSASATAAGAGSGNINGGF